MADNEKNGPSQQELRILLALSVLGFGGYGAYAVYNELGEDGPRDISLLPSLSPAMPMLKSASLNASSGSKFVDLCFDRPLQKREDYRVEMTISTVTDKQAQCSGHVSYDLGKMNDQPRCYPFYIHANCLKRHSTEQERDIVDNHINPGKVRQVMVALHSTRGEGAGSYAFSDL